MASTTTQDGLHSNMTILVREEFSAHAPHQSNRISSNDNETSKSMLEYLVSGLCAEDDSVTLQRSSRLLKHRQLDALPPPSKFAQASKLSTGLRRPKSTVIFCAQANTFLHKEFHNVAAQSRSPDPSNWACAFLRAGLMEGDFQLLRPPSLGVRWDSLMSKLAMETEEAADEEAPPGRSSVVPPTSDALADATCSPRARPSSCGALPCTHWAGGERAREAN
jgi:hypothetical protein